jgi:hypothetical protein
MPGGKWFAIHGICHKRIVMERLGKRQTASEGECTADIVHKPTVSPLGYNLDSVGVKTCLVQEVS